MLSPSSAFVSGVKVTDFFRTIIGVTGAAGDTSFEFFFVFLAGPSANESSLFLLGDSIGLKDSGTGSEGACDFSLRPNLFQAGT